MVIANIFIYARQYAGILLAVVVLLLSVTTTTLAQPTGIMTLNGYAWSGYSDGGVGWISFNCATGGDGGSNICGTSNYQVTIQNTGAMTGYAWSSVGWIKFGGLSGFPSGSGTTPVNARVTGTNPDLTFSGWARACSVFVDTNACSGTLKPDLERGGWDGWISLGGTNSDGTNYSVTTNASGFVPNSYAWGGPYVFGWIDMSSHTSFTMPVATLTGPATCSIAVGASTCPYTIGWTFTDVTNPNIYRFAAPTGVGTGPLVATPTTPTGSQSLTLQPGNYTFQARDGSTVLAFRDVSVSCVSGATWDGSTSTCVLTTVSPPPTISFVAPTPPIVRSGATVPLHWQIDPGPLSDGTCSLTGPGINQTNITTSGSATIGAIYHESQYTLSCTGSYGTVSVSKTIIVAPAFKEI